MANYRPTLICRKCNMQAATAYLPHRRYSPTYWGDQYFHQKRTAQQAAQ